MSYMDKPSSRIQKQSYFLKSGVAGREQWLHPGSEGGVPRAGPNPG